MTVEQYGSLISLSAGLAMFIAGLYLGKRQESTEPRILREQLDVERMRVTRLESLLASKDPIAYQYVRQADSAEEIAREVRKHSESNGETPSWAEELTEEQKLELQYDHDGPFLGDDN